MLKIRDNYYNTQLSPQFLLDCDLQDAACDGNSIQIMCHLLY